MKNFRLFNFTLVVFSAAYLSATEPAQQENNSPKNSHVEISKISEAFGHLIGKNIESMGVQFDIQYVIKGLKDAAEGIDSPMTEMECVQAITEAQEFAFKEQSEVNLKAAEEFLKKNGKAEGTVSIAEGKVQYKVDKEGAGEALSETGAPMIRYTGKFLDGTVFGSSKEDERISLDELIPGLKAGLAGMKEGEKRTIHIHPDLAYGTRSALPPNSLLTFEIELVKANAPVQLETLETSNPKNQEIVLPETPLEQVR